MILWIQLGRSCESLELWKSRNATSTAKYSIASVWKEFKSTNNRVTLGAAVYFIWAEMNDAIFQPVEPNEYRIAKKVTTC